MINETGIMGIDVDSGDGLLEKKRDQIKAEWDKQVYDTNINKFQV